MWQLGRRESISMGLDVNVVAGCVVSCLEHSLSLTECSLRALTVLSALYEFANVPVLTTACEISVTIISI